MGQVLCSYRKLPVGVVLNALPRLEKSLGT
jgi:hypothetical protein